MTHLNRRRLREFIGRHADSASALRSWWDTVQAAEWHTFGEVRRTYSTVRYVDPYTVFNIKGNDTGLSRGSTTRAGSW